MTTRIALVGARVLVDGAFAARTVVVERGRIVALVDGEARIDDATEHDWRGFDLAPGFIDLQVNGGGDVLFNDAPTVASIERIASAHRSFGTTGLLPTLITDERDVMRRAIAAVDAAIEAGVPGVLGIHLEGPFLAAARKGVHDARKIIAPTDDDLDLLSSLQRGRTLVTLAPECVPPAFIAALVARGVVVAAGHTAADYDTMQRAIDAGLSGVTHLYNAMSPLGSREPGVVGAALDANLFAGLIADGRHVHPAAMRVAHKALGDRLFLVTDAMPPVGGMRSTFRLGELEVVAKDGACVTADGVLAGAALDMQTAVANAVSMLRVPRETALAMASTGPARFIGVEQRHGIAVGAPADLVVLDGALRTRATYIAGRRFEA